VSAIGQAPTGQSVGGMLGKGLTVLRLVAERGSVTVPEIAQFAGLSRSSAYRLVDRLRAGGYLQEARVAGALRLGPSAVPIGLAALNQMDLMDIAPARLLRLAREAGETVNLAVAQGDEMVYVYQAEGPGAVKVTARLGTRRPLSCSSLGKAYLAALPDGEREQRLASIPLARLTGRSIADAASFRREVEATAARGYALDEQEVEDGVACVGAAVRDVRGRPVAAISIAGPAERMPGKRDQLVTLLRAAAEDLSLRLGYPG
jgi:IclR family transcriptional regulator, acetate operon repressor